MKILVIDDDPAILEAIKIICDDLGYRVTLSENDANIRDKINKAKPHLIFFDVLLKGRNSCALIKKLKSETRYKKIPILLLSANNNIEKFAALANADSFLAKPFDIKDFQKTVEKYNKVLTP